MASAAGTGPEVSAGVRAATMAVQTSFLSRLHRGAAIDERTRRRITRDLRDYVKKQVP